MVSKWFNAQFLQICSWENKLLHILDGLKVNVCSLFWVIYSYNNKYNQINEQDLEKINRGNVEFRFKQLYEHDVNIEYFSSDPIWTVLNAAIKLLWSL